MPTYASMFPGSSLPQQEEEENRRSLVPAAAPAPRVNKLPTVEQLASMPLPGEDTGQELALGKNLVRGLQGGIDQTQAMGYGAAALAGNALGLEGLEAWGREGQQRNLKEAAQYAPAPGESGASFSEADSFTDYANWAARTVGEQVPNLLTMMAGGGIGGVAAKSALGGIMAKGAMGLGKEAVTGGAAKLAAKEFLVKGSAVRLPTAAAQKAAEGYLRAGKYGTVAGGLAASTAMEGGGMYGDQVEAGLEPRASQIALPAAAAGALDWLVPGRAMTRTYGQGAKGALAATGRVLGTMGAEGATETGQGIIERATLEDARGTLNTPEGQARVFDPRAMTEEAAAGALIGGGFGAVQQAGDYVVGRRLAQERTAAEERQRAAMGAPQEDPAVVEQRRQAALAERAAAREARLAANVAGTDIMELDATRGLKGGTLYAGPPEEGTGLSPVYRRQGQMEEAAAEKERASVAAVEAERLAQRQLLVEQAREKVRQATERAAAARAVGVTPSLLMTEQTGAAPAPAFDLERERAQLAKVVGGERVLQELEDSGLFRFIDEEEAVAGGWGPGRNATYNEETGEAVVRKRPGMAAAAVHEGWHAGDEIALYLSQPWVGSQLARQAKKGDVNAASAIERAIVGIEGAEGVDGWVKRATENRGGQAPSAEEIAQKRNKEVGAYFIEEAQLREGEKATGLLGRILGEVKASWLASPAGQRLMQRGIAPRLDDRTALSLAKRAVQAAKERGELSAAWERVNGPEKPPEGPGPGRGGPRPLRQEPAGAVSFGQLSLGSERRGTTLESVEQLRDSPAFKTPEFRAWFEGSALQDEQGKPRLLFHGTRRQLEGQNLRGGSTGLIDRKLGVHVAYEPEMTEAFTVGAYAQTESPYWSEERNKKSFLERKGEWGEQNWIEPGGQTIPLVSNVKKIYKVPQRALGWEGGYETDQAVIGAVASAVAARRRPELFIDWAAKMRNVPPEMGKQVYQELSEGRLREGDHRIGLSQKQVEAAGGDPFLALFKDYGPMEWGQFGGEELSDVVAREFKQELLAKGYDALEYRNTSSNEKVRGKEGEPALIVLEPEKTLKSAVGNKGGWRKESGDLLESVSAQTKTPEFKNWFGDSKVVDEAGQPKLMYHGTLAAKIGPEAESGGITEFKPGSHFGSSRQAEEFADREGGHIYPVWLSMKNPLRIKDSGIQHNPEILKKEVAAALGVSPEGASVEELLKGAGHDGIVYLNRKEGYSRLATVWADAQLHKDWTDEQWKAKYPQAEDSYIPIDREQIKSAVGNKGGFKEGAGLLESVGRNPAYGLDALAKTTTDWKGVLGRIEAATQARGQVYGKRGGFHFQTAEQVKQMLGGDVEPTEVENGFYDPETNTFLSRIDAKELTRRAGQEPERIRPWLQSEDLNQVRGEGWRNAELGREAAGRAETAQRSSVLESLDVNIPPEMLTKRIDKLGKSGRYHIRLEKQTEPKPGAWYDRTRAELAIGPELTKGLDVVAASTFRGENSGRLFIDPALAHIEADELSPDLTRRRPRLRPESGLVQQPEGSDEKEEGFLWRGMSSEEFEEIKKTGIIASRGDMNFTEQLGTTSFATRPSSGFAYAHGFAPTEYKASFGKPAYVIKVTAPGEAQEAKIEGMDRGYERSLRNGVPASSIVEVWEGVPYAMEEGKTELTRDGQNKWETSIEGAPATYVGWRKRDDLLFSEAGAGTKAAPTEQEVLESFIGRLAETAPKMLRARAEQMEAAGEKPERIRRVTGWLRHPVDKEWRYEISDAGVRWKSDWASMPDTGLLGKGTRLDQVLDAPELFAAYPELREVTFKKRGQLFDFLQQTQGWYDDKNNTLVVSPHTSDPLGVALHETQHWIQNKEGWGPGGNTESVRLDDEAALEKLELRYKLQPNASDAPTMLRKIQEVRGKKDMLSGLYDRLFPARQKIEQLKATVEDLRQRQGSEVNALLEEEKKVALDEHERALAEYQRERDAAFAKYKADQSSWFEQKWARLKSAYGTPEYDQIKEELGKTMPVMANYFNKEYPAPRYVSRFIREGEEPSKAALLNKWFEDQQKAARTELKSAQAYEKLLADELSEQTKSFDDVKFGLYELISGEVEARLTASRRELSAEERELYSPSTGPKSQDTSYYRQILLKREKGAGQAEALESVAPPFYSALKKTVQESKQQTASPMQWKGWLVGQGKDGVRMSKQPGVRLEEIEDTGLEEWLDAQGGRKVGKDEVLAFLEQGGVRVEEVVRGGPDTLGTAWYVAYVDGPTIGQSFASQEEAMAELNDLFPERNDVEVRQGVGERAQRQNAETKYGRYTVPGGRNYRELLITIPAKPFDAGPGASPTTQRMRLNGDDTANYHGAHWDEPNVLVHLRFSERTGTDGKKTLLVEEVQSDWHQEGRKKGYRGQLPSGYAVKQRDQGDWAVFQPNATEPVIWGAASQEEAAMYAFQDAGIAPAEFVPNAPMKDSATWAMLGMKRAIKWAADNGFDRVAWTPGQVQFDRWGSEAFTWTKTRDGWYLNGEEQRGGNVFAGMEEELAKQAINDGEPVRSRRDIRGVVAAVMGRERDSWEPARWNERVDKITDKIWERMGKEETGILLPRKDGMEAFYDKMLPTEVGKYLKKYGGRVGTAALDLAGQEYKVNRDSQALPYRLERQDSPDILARFATAEEAWVEAERRGRQEVWSFDLPEKLVREAKEQGVPLYSEQVPAAGASYPSDFAARNQALRESDPTLWQKARNTLYRAVVPGGLIRAKAPGGFAAVVQRNARQTMVDKDAEIMVHRLEKAALNAYGKRWNLLDTGTKEEINAALAGGNDELKRLPQELRELVVGMRQRVDAFSKEYVQELLMQIEDMGRSGAALGERAQKDIAAKQALIKVLADNVGRYLHRSYKMFDDSQWFKHIGDDVYNRARGWLMAENALTAEQADKWMEAFLKNGTAYDSLEDYVREGKIGETDKRILLKRGEIPQPLLDLMGEYKDPRINFVKTITKASRLVINTRFQREFLRIGLANKWLFRADDLDRPTTGIAKEIPGGKGYEHLAGLYTYPEVAKGLRDILQRNSAEPWLRKTQEIIAMAKWAKTIGSPVPTGLRNFLANIMALTANADFSTAGFSDAWNAAEEYLWDVSAVGAEQRARRSHLALLGVSLDTPYAGEMQELGRLAGIESALGVTGSEVGKKWEGTRRVGREMKGWLERAYQYGDDFFKIIAFDSQRKQLSRVLMPELRQRYAAEAQGTARRWEIGSGPVELREQSDGRWSYVDAFGFNIRKGQESWATEAEARAKAAEVLSLWDVENQAAERVRNTYMTYSMVGNLPKWLARFPLTGTFVSFPVEVMRTVSNQIAYAAKDWADPKMRGLAARRSLGLMAAAMVPTVAGMVGMALTGADEEEMEGARQAMADWNKLSNLVAAGRTEDGHLEVMDLGYYDLYKLWRLPFNAAANPDPLGEDLWNVAKELALPFVGLDMTTKAVVEVLRNRRMEGGPIWEMTDTPAEQSGKIAAHLLTPFTSTTLLQLEKIYEAHSGKVMRDGREMSAINEWGALGGTKIFEARPRSMLFYHNFEFQADKGMAEYGLRRLVSDPNEVTDEELADEAGRAWTQRREAYERLGRKVKAAQALGMSPLSIRLELKHLGVAAKDLGWIMRGELPPWAPTASTLLGAVKSGEALGMGAEHRQRVMARRRQVLQRVRELDQQARQGLTSE